MTQKKSFKLASEWVQQRKKLLKSSMQVARMLYDGISTQKILNLIFILMRKSKPAVKHLFDLRRGISLMVT